MCKIQGDVVQEEVIYILLAWFCGLWRPRVGNEAHVKIG